MKRIFNLKILLLPLLLLCNFNAPIARAESAALFFSPAYKQVMEGQIFTVDVKIKSPTQSINAISGAVAFPESLLKVVSISKGNSIVKFWTKDPAVLRNKISFEGVILNPGFRGNDGLVFRISFEAKAAGSVPLGFSEGAILANDGKGTNVLASLGSANFKIVTGSGLPDFPIIAEGEEPSGSNILALPVITDYSPLVNSKDGFYLKGRGEPRALTKIVFKDISSKSIGEQLVAFSQTKKKKLGEILVNNDATGAFEYVSSKDLVAGVYNATPFLVDNSSNTEKPGLGVQLLVDDSKIVKAFVVVLNVLALLIPMVILLVIIYFIPWYSMGRMRILKRKFGLEEEKIILSSHKLERRDKAL
jgi:hypothetical protein